VVTDFVEVSVLVFVVNVVGMDGFTVTDGFGGGPMAVIVDPPPLPVGAGTGFL
jgi:hypothetical protein